MEERALGPGDVLADVAAQEHGDIVLLEDRAPGIARETDRIGEGADFTELDARGATVDRQVHVRLLRHVAAKVRQAPGDGHAQARRRGRVTAVELCQRVLELPLGALEVVGRNARRDEGMVEGWHEDRNAVVPNN